jgi:hypothetical protein
MNKTFKVWIETETYQPNQDDYTRGTEPLDLEVKSEKEAIRLQCTLHQIGMAILDHYKKGWNENTADHL